MESLGKDEQYIFLKKENLLHTSQVLIPITQLLYEDAGRAALFWMCGKWHAFIWPWFHVRHGPPGCNDDTIGHRKFRPLTTMFTPLCQPVGTLKVSVSVYGKT